MSSTPSPPQSPAPLRTPTRLSMRRDAAGASSLSNRRPLQSPYLRRRQAELDYSEYSEQDEADEEAPLEPRRLHRATNRPSLEPPKRLTRPSLEGSYASKRLARPSLEPPTSYTAKRLNRPSLEPAQSSFEPSSTSKRLARPSLDTGEQPRIARPRQHLARPSLEARNNITANTRPSLEPRRTNRPSLEPKPRLARPSLEARNNGNSNSNRPNRPSLEPRNGINKPNRPSLESKSRATRPSLEPQSPRPANNRTSRAYRNSKQVTPSQTRLEAARKRREAAEAAQAQPRTPVHQLSTQSRLEAAKKRREAAEAANEEAKNAIMKRRSRLPAAALSSASRSEGSAKGPRAAPFRAGSTRADEGGITPSRITIRSSRYGRPSMPEEGSTNANPPRTRLMDRGTGTADDVPHAPSPRVRQRRANESPSRARRAPTIDVAQRRASEVSTKLAKETAAIPPRRTSDIHEMPVSRRLDLDAVSAGSRARTKQSRVEAMNAIAASTMGSLDFANGGNTDTEEDVDKEKEDDMNPKGSDHVLVLPRTPGKHRGALESFRRTRRASQEARRASLEAEAAAKAEEEEAQGPTKLSSLSAMPMTSISAADSGGLGDRSEPGGALGAAWTPKKVEVEAATIDEAHDGNSSSAAAKKKKSSYERFSHGRISIDKVEELKYSLGTRRRSRAGQDYSTIEPPSLSRSRSARRSSCTASPVVLQPASSFSARRSPLGTLDTHNTSLTGNTNNDNNMMIYKLRASKSFAIDDDRLSWADMADDDTDDFLTTK